MTRVLGFGGGKQTIGLLLMEDNWDYVLFADTGGEKPETYQYIEKYVLPYCEQKGYKFVVVKSRLGPLYEYAFSKKTIPKRQLRWCTDKFKIKPCMEFERDVLKHTRHNPVDHALGISYDEAVERLTNRKSYYPLQKLFYPLVEQKKTTQDCIDVIKAKGWEVPPKSGCYFCPFARKQDFIDLKIKHPELFKKVIELEKNHPAYPRMILRSKPIEDWIKVETMDDFQSCDEGVCFV